MLTSPPEEKKFLLVTNIATSKSSNKTDFWIQLFLKFSSFTKLQRTVAYILRFKNNKQKLQSSGFITRT